jgi:hypothetical protein
MSSVVPRRPVTSLVSPESGSYTKDELIYAIGWLGSVYAEVPGYRISLVKAFSILADRITLDDESFTEADLWAVIDALDERMAEVAWANRGLMDRSKLAEIRWDARWATVENIKTILRPATPPSKEQIRWGYGTSFPPAPRD